MQMDKKNYSGCQDEPKLSAEGIRFEPEAAQARDAEIDLSGASISAGASLRAEALAADARSAAERTS